MFSFRISSIAAHTSLLLSLVRLLAFCFYLRIKALDIASTKCLTFSFGVGVIVRLFFSILSSDDIFFSSIIFFWWYHLKLVVTLQDRTDEERSKGWKIKGQASQKRCTYWILILIVEKYVSILLLQLLLRRLLWFWE